MIPPTPTPVPPTPPVPGTPLTPWEHIKQFPASVWALPYRPKVVTALIAAGALYVAYGYGYGNGAVIRDANVEKIIEKRVAPLERKLERETVNKEIEAGKPLVDGVQKYTADVKAKTQNAPAQYTPTVKSAVPEVRARPQGLGRDLVEMLTGYVPPQPRAEGQTEVAVKLVDGSLRTYQLSTYAKAELTTMLPDLYDGSLSYHNRMHAQQEVYRWLSQDGKSISDLEVDRSFGTKSTYDALKAVVSRHVDVKKR